MTYVSLPVSNPLEGRLIPPAKCFVSVHRSPLWLPSASEGGTAVYSPLSLWGRPLSRMLEKTSLMPVRALRTVLPATKSASLSCITIRELPGSPVSASYGTRANTLLPIRTTKDEPSNLDGLESMPSIPSREHTPLDPSLVPQRFLPGLHRSSILRPSCCQPLDQDADIESRCSLGPATSNLRGSPYLHNTPEVDTELSKHSLHPANRVGIKRQRGSPSIAPSRIKVREASERISTGICTTTGRGAGLFIDTPTRRGSTSHAPACYVAGMVPPVSEHPRDDCRDHDATEGPQVMWDQSKLTGRAWGRDQAYEINAPSCFTGRNTREKYDLDPVCPSPGIVRQRSPIPVSPLVSHEFSRFMNTKSKFRSIEPITASGWYNPDYERYAYYTTPLKSEDSKNEGGSGGNDGGGRKRKRGHDEGDERGRDDKRRDEGDEEDGDEGGEPPRKRRKKTEMACRFCRGRKLKCDGRRPTCGNCVTRHLDCHYDEAIRRRGPGKKKKTKLQEEPQGQQPQASASTTSLSTSLYRDVPPPYPEVLVVPPPAPPLTPTYPFPIGKIPSSARLETHPRSTEAGPSSAYVQQTQQGQRDTRQPPRLQPGPSDQPYSYERTYQSYQRHGQWPETPQRSEPWEAQAQGPESLPRTAARITGSLSLSSEPSYRRDSSEDREELHQSDDGDDGYTSETPLLRRRTSSPPETEGPTGRHPRREK